MTTINKRAYAEMYGPTTGDRVRLGDTPGPCIGPALEGTRWRAGDMQLFGTSIFWDEIMMHRFPEVSQAAKALRARKLLVSAVAMTMMAGPAGAQTVTPQSVNGFQHFADCLNVLLADSQAHAAYCSPSNILPSLATLSSGGGGNSDPGGPTGETGVTGPTGQTGPG